MRIKWPVIFASVFLCAFIFLPAASADEFQVTGQTNLPVCTAVAAQCGSVTFNLLLQTQSAANVPYGNVYDVVSMTGTLDGTYSITGSGGFLLPVQGNAQSPIPYGPISYTLNGLQGEISFDDMIGGCSFISLLPSSAASAFITWNATLVNTPEPSTLLCLALGLLAAFALIRKRIPA
jgi:hypothetical protein